MLILIFIIGVMICIFYVIIFFIIDVMIFIFYVVILLSLACDDIYSLCYYIFQIIVIS